MEIAFLFDADDPKLGMWYGQTVMRYLLDTGVLQTAKRPMRASLGDIVTFMTVAKKGGSLANLHALNERLYLSEELDLVLRDKLERVLSKGTVYCWVFQNMTRAISTEMHKKLGQFSSYLGAMAIDFSFEPHLAFFRNCLVEKYRFSGLTISEFFHLGSNEDPDLATKELFEKYGFSLVYEDIGARRTIFDNYDSIDHFRRVAEFRNLFSRINGLTADDASSITIFLEELHPQLFDVFAAAARALRDAETEEDLAQAALSGRRLVEKLADYLYPSRTQQVEGRNVGPTQYKNRLLAYIDQIMSEVGLSDCELNVGLGKEISRLIDLFNGGLHANATQQQVEGAFRDFVIWLAKLIELSPAHARKPYLAYQTEVRRYTEELRTNFE